MAIDDSETAPPDPRFAEGKRKKERPVPVASIHTHFNINRQEGTDSSGPVTYDEQLKAVARHIKWHERQVAVGKELLAKLIKEKEKSEHEESGL